jgi:hypothetical protein
VSLNKEYGKTEIDGYKAVKRVAESKDRAEVRHFTIKED